MWRGFYDLMCSTFTGDWWFATQDPIDLDPVHATITENPDEGSEDVFVEIDDGTPLPPPTGSDKPDCVACGDPNFSLESNLCIACRVGMGSSLRPEGESV